MNVDRIYDEAAGWLVRVQGDSMDWAGFTAWLEADPRNREAYDELAFIEDQLDERREPLRKLSPAFEPVASNDRKPVRWGRWAGFGGGAVAAGLALLLVLRPVGPSVPVREYRSLPGQKLNVALAGGTHVLLAPASRMTVRGESLTLVGTGYFDVPHQPGRTFTVRAGDFTLTDIGTRFSVENEPDGVSVEVAEGKVSVGSAGFRSPLELAAGHGMHAPRSGSAVSLSTIKPQEVADWRNGKLDFDQVPLLLVARDISRYSGVKVTVDPVIAEQPFSGVIAIDDGEAPARNLAQILSLDLKRVDGALRLEPRGH